MALPSTTLDAYSGRLLDSMKTGSIWSFPGDVRVITWGTANNQTIAWADPQQAEVVIDRMFDTIEAHINVRFQYVGHFQSFTQATADITFNLADSSFPGWSPTTYAEAVFPYDTYVDQWLQQKGVVPADYPFAAGDVWLNIQWGIPGSDAGAPGSRLFNTALHEIGHSLGLKHPHDEGINNGPLFPTVGWGQFDTNIVTMMSYNDPPGATDAAGFPTGMVPLDILVLQELYGVNPSIPMELWARNTVGAAIQINAFMNPTAMDAASLVNATDVMTTLNVTHGSAAGWVAYGASLADSQWSATFASRYGALTDAQFIEQIHLDVFGYLPVDNKAALERQLDIFQDHYVSHASGTDVSGMVRARGGFAADMIHQATDYYGHGLLV